MDLTCIFRMSGHTKRYKRSHSPVFDDVEQGNPPRVNFFVNQRPYDMAYFLADGIYPSYPNQINPTSSE